MRHNSTFEEKMEENRGKILKFNLNESSVEEIARECAMDEYGLSPVSFVERIAGSVHANEHNNGLSAAVASMAETYNISIPTVLDIAIKAENKMGSIFGKTKNSGNEEQEEQEEKKTLKQ